MLQYVVSVSSTHRQAYYDMYRILFLPLMQDITPGEVVVIVSVAVVIFAVAVVMLGVVDSVVGGCAGQISAELLEKISSARCTHSDSGCGKNCRTMTDRVVFSGKHTLTRESHEVGGTLKRPSADLGPEIDGDARIITLCTDIPHCGQLNINTSTLPTPA